MNQKGPSGRKVNIQLRQLYQLMQTTITISDKTRARLADYRLGNLTYDDVLNLFMDRVDLEDISVEHVLEHYRRLADFKGVPAEEVQARIAKRLAGKR